MCGRENRIFIGTISIEEEKFIPEDYCMMNIKYKNKCLFHHYSWVRTLEEMKSKVLNWGHSDDHLFVEIEYNNCGLGELTKNKVTGVHKINNKIKRFFFLLSVWLV